MPTRLSYETERVGSRKSIVAEDGVWAVLETPVGTAMAVREKLTDFQAKFSGSPTALWTLFPGDTEQHGERGRRKREYETHNEGRVTITAEEFDSEHE